MEKLIKVGQFFRIIDENGQLSLTNIAVMVGLYKLCQTNGTNLNDAGLMIGTLLNYAAKKYMNSKD